MAGKTLIGGAAYDMKAGETLIGGVGYEISAGKTLIGGVAYDIEFASYDPVFANNTWAQIIAACQNNEVPDTWAVGDHKDMTINGAAYQIDIIGKNHDTYTLGGTAPLTFQLHDLYATTYPFFASGFTGWESSALRTSTMATLLGYLPSEVRAAVKEVSKTTSKVQGKKINYVTTTDKLFLPSATELAGEGTTEGRQYAYYAGRSRVKYRNGSAENWWTRSAVYSSLAQARYVTTSGTINSVASGYSYGVAFAFCF